MPSFDIVSKVDAQALDNAVNVTTKELTNRFDFKGSHVVIDLNKKEFKINLEAESEMKLQQVIENKALPGACDFFIFEKSFSENC